MVKVSEMEEMLYELEQTTATLGFVQTAFAEGSSCINMKEASDALYMLYRKQDDTLKELKKAVLN